VCTAATRFAGSIVTKGEPTGISSAARARIPSASPLRDTKLLGSSTDKLYRFRDNPLVSKLFGKQRNADLPVRLGMERDGYFFVQPVSDEVVRRQIKESVRPRWRRNGKANAAPSTRGARTGLLAGIAMSCAKIHQSGGVQ
jgi:hypothetical protein